MPDDIIRPAQVGVDHRDLDEHGVDDVVVTVDVAVADDLDVRAGLGNNCRNILEHVRSQAGLDDEQMGASLDGLQDTEIVDVPVTVEVEVVEHI